MGRAAGLAEHVFAAGSRRRRLNIDGDGSRESNKAAIARVLARLFADAVHPRLANDAALKQLILDMGDEVGPDAFMRQLEAIMTRADARPCLHQSSVRRWC